MVNRSDDEAREMAYRIMLEENWFGRAERPRKPRWRQRHLPSWAKSPILDPVPEVPAPE